MEECFLKDYGTLKLLCDTSGITGFERRTSELVKNYFSSYCDETVLDEFNNVVGIIRANGRKNIASENGEKKERPYRIMIAAHIDEIGMLVKKHEKGGFLRIGRISGVDPKTLLASRVVVHSSSGRDIKGIIGALPPHLVKEDDKEKAPDFDDLFVDTGLKDDELRNLVSVGDPVSIFSPLEQHHNKRIVSGKALDNRISVMAMIKAMEMLKKSGTPNDIIFVASVREETNSMGAAATAYSLQPDLGIVIDATHGKTGNEDDGDERTFICGKGPVVCIAPILSRKITDYLIKICKEKGYSGSVEVDNGDTGTDALSMTVASRGIPCGLISIPVKYMHTQVEMADMKDINAAAQVLAEFARSSLEMVRDLLCS